MSGMNRECEIRNKDEFGEAAACHRTELQRAVARRLDRSLRARIDPSDVVQEAHVEALERLSGYVAKRPLPLGIWLYRTAVQRLLKLRQHAQATRRDIRRDRSLRNSHVSCPDHDIPAQGPTPSQQLAAQERTGRLSVLIQRLSESDQEILELRVFQSLPYEDLGARLSIEPAAARKRYGRALLRLRSLLLADGLTESRL
jgi:RNA polymerase sigma-70 factor (ECF subfamily)